MEKIIHCIWLGGEKTELARRCRASWEKFAPGWTIREWNLCGDANGTVGEGGEGVGLRCRCRVEGGTLGSADRAPVRGDANGTVLGAGVPDYVRAALAARKWAFAADWLRFVVLEREGGVYFDYDLELVKPIDDLVGDEWIAGELVQKGAAVGMNPCAIALERGSEVARRMLSVYATAEFSMEKTVGDLMSEAGITMKVLAPEVFCPSDHRGRLFVTDATRGIHRYALSWISPRRRIARWLNWHGMSWLTDWGVRVMRWFNEG